MDLVTCVLSDSIGITVTIHFTQNAKASDQSSFYYIVVQINLTHVQLCMYSLQSRADRLRVFRQINP